MGRISRYLGIMVLLAGVVGVVIGSVFIAQAIEKSNWMSEAMRIEHVTLGLDETAVARGEVVDSAEEAQVAGNMIREHRRNIASTYDELLGGGHLTQQTRSI